MNGDLPFYIGILAPLERQADAISVTVSAWPAELRPILLGGNGQGNDEKTEKNAHVQVLTMERGGANKFGDKLFCKLWVDSGEIESNSGPRHHFLDPAHVGPENAK